MHLHLAGLEGALVGQGAVDPGLHAHLPHRRLVGAGLAAGWRHAVAVRHDAGLRLRAGEGHALDVLDVVHALVAGHHQPQRAAMRQRQRLAIHLPGQQRIIHRLHGHRALHQHRQRVHPLGQLLAARAGQVGRAVGQPAQGRHHVAQRHATPDHAARGAYRPGGAAGLAGEKAPAVARALQHGGHGLHAQRLELGQGQAARAFDPFDGHRPRVAVVQDGRVGRGQVVAHVQLVGRRDDAGAKRGAPRFQGAAAVHDQRIRRLPPCIGGQRLGCGGGGLLGARTARPSGQAQRAQGGSTSGQHVAARQGHRIFHANVSKEWGEQNLSPPIPLASAGHRASPHSVRQPCAPHVRHR